MSADLPYISLLQDVFSEGHLDNLLISTNCLKTLNILLHIKQQRILHNKSAKIDLPCEAIYKEFENIDIDLQCSILGKALAVVKNREEWLSQSVEFFIDNVKINDVDNNKVLNNLKLFNVVLICNQETDNLFFKHFLFLKQEDLHKIILRLLYSSSTPTNNFLMIHFVHNYFKIVDKETESDLLERIFEKVKMSGKLDVLCALIDDFLSPRFNLMGQEALWIILSDHICSRHNYMQKQAIYILSKFVASVKEVSVYVSHNMKQEELKNSWRNYFILVDVSNEKQLHLVEPSLKLLDSIQNLHPLWRFSLYKKILTHSQNAVVYFIITYVLKNETDWTNIRTIIRELLDAMNKNEFSTETRKVFQEFHKFCSVLDSGNIEIILQESLNISWTPAAVWCCYSSIFDEKIHFKISLLTLENLINKLQFIPNIFIREVCMRLIIDHFVKYFVSDSLKSLTKFLSILVSVDKRLFENYIFSHQDKIIIYKYELIENLESEQNLKHFEILLTLLISLEVDVMQSFNKISSFKYSARSDIFFDLSSAAENVNFQEIESYLIHRLNSIQDNEDATNLILLLKKQTSQKITDKAVQILEEDDEDKFSTVQKIIAFSIINNNFSNNCLHVIELWKNRFIKANRKPVEAITILFVDALMKHYLNAENLEDVILILENVLDSQSQAVSNILENIGFILMFININTEIVQAFMRQCFIEFFKLNKNNTCKAFLDATFKAEYFENETFSGLIVEFAEDLLNVSNNSHQILSYMSQNIMKLIKHNARNSAKFSTVIVDLVLHGIIIEKNDRVIYLINQEICNKVNAIDKSPNLEDVSVRLWALEGILCAAKSENMADKFASVLMLKYRKYFNKRYFPDSQIHLEKLRIAQVLILLSPHLRGEKTNLINLISESFLVESHQTSVKHLLQWLLVLLLKDDPTSLNFVSTQLKNVNTSRPSTVTAFIPVLYHLALYKNAELWDQVVEVLLPCTMGPQFKLRVFSQVALVKLYEKAIANGYLGFLKKHKFLYESIKYVTESSGNVPEFSTIERDFLDYFPLDSCDCSTIYYTIPKINKVTPIEWENLESFSRNKNFEHVKFNHEYILNDVFEQNETTTAIFQDSQNIQKKITPWKDQFKDENFGRKTNDFILITTLVEKSTNLGGLARTCEVFGVKRLVMKTSKIVSDKEFQSLSMSSESWLDITEVKVEDLKSFILKIKSTGYVVIGAEQTSESVQLHQFKFPQKTVLLLGNEKEGISPELIPLLDSCIEIPQFGVVRSLNVHVAGAVVIWEYCKQHLL